MTIHLDMKIIQIEVDIDEIDLYLPSRYGTYLSLTLLTSQFQSPNQLTVVQ